MRTGASPPAQAFPQGSAIIYQGDIPKEVFIISNGLIKLTRLEETGYELIVGLRYPGSFLGAAAVILQKPSPATAITLTPSHLHRLVAEQFLDRLKTDSEFSWRVNVVNSYEIYDQLSLLAGIAGLTARQRLERLLWQLVVSQEGGAVSGQVQLCLPLKKWEIAELIAITPIHVSRLFRSLEQDQLLKRHKHYLTFSNAEKLWHRDV